MRHPPGIRVSGKTAARAIGFRSRIVGSALFAVCLLVATNPAVAQDRYTIRIAAGLSEFSGSLDNLYEGGLSLEVGISKQASRRLAVGLAVGFNRHSFADGRAFLLPASPSPANPAELVVFTGDHLSFLQVLATVRLSLLPESRTIRPYLRAGLGYTRLDSGEFFASNRSDIAQRLTNSPVGGLIGGGLSFQLDQRIGLFLDGSLRFDMDDGIDKLLGVTVGLEYRL